MKLTAEKIDGTIIELTVSNRPQLTFEEVEIFTPNGKAWVPGSHSWNRLLAETSLDDLADGKAFTMRSVGEPDGQWVLETCYVMANKKEIFFVNAILY